jgi:hypothetical protein
MWMRGKDQGRRVKFPEKDPITPTKIAVLEKLIRNTSCILFSSSAV